jgi:hypothetical protein
MSKVNKTNHDAEVQVDRHTTATVKHIDKNSLISSKKLKRLEATVVSNYVSHTRGCNQVILSTRPGSSDDHRFVPTQLVLNHKEAATVAEFLLKQINNDYLINNTASY